MASRPRVYVNESIERATIQSHGGGVVYDRPCVEVSVDFTLHDHEAALQALDVVVKRVKAQIAEAS